MIKKTILILFFIILMLPVYFMIIGSLQDIHGVMKMPPRLIPSNMILDNYLKLFSWNVRIWLFNSILVCTGTVILSVFLSCSGGYVFSFYRFKYKKIIWSSLLVGMMIPRISMIIPLYVIMRKLGLSGTLYAVVFPIVFSPVGLYLARNYFSTIPISLLESARLDGANEFQILYKIVMPVSKPIIVALSVFASIGVLQDYIWQMLVLQDQEKQTLLVGLMRQVMIRGGGADTNVNPIGRTLAVGVVLLLPLLVIFLVANKYFVSSLSGAMKE